ncbi:Uncharacterised protein [Mycobacteroides abscessus subsp. abscessus]|nr:Uncharacterised protein [Mycobacteroides abscessus subsp. abscessus]
MYATVCSSVMPAVLTFIVTWCGRPSSPVVNTVELWCAEDHFGSTSKSAMTSMICSGVASMTISRVSLVAMI